MRSVLVVNYRKVLLKAAGAGKILLLLRFYLLARYAKNRGHYITWVHVETWG